MVRLNHDQTTLTAAFSDCALIQRGLNESNHDQILSLLLAQAVQRFGDVRMSQTMKGASIRGAEYKSARVQVQEYFARVQCGSTLSNLFKLDRTTPNSC